MPRKKKYLNALTTLLISLLLSSCITPPDVRVCVRRPFKSGAQCHNTLSPISYNMKESEYELQEVGMVFMGPKAFGEIKKFIKEICIKYPNRCPEMQDSLEKIELEFSSF